MDLMTAAGLGGAAALLLWGMREGTALTAFLNLHGVLVVAGGTACAALVNCSAAELWGAARAGAGLFLAPAHRSPEEEVVRLVELCRLARQGGPRALREAAAGEDFLARCLEACLTLSDREAAREALERDINWMRARHTASANVFRVLGLLAPMFGLLGTLIGIIAVLRSLSDPVQAGPAMAAAVSSAFYGILLANLLFVPMANKLRSRSLAEALTREVAMTGALEVCFSTRAPSALESFLSGFAAARRAAEAGGAPAPAGAER